MLEAVGLWKSYEGKQVIRDFSMAFLQEGKYCFMGPSGCGKTTLLRLLAGLEKPDRGRVLGLETMRASVVFQENRLLEGHTAAENISLVSGVSRERAEALLKRLGLEEESFLQPVYEYSGGMKRRVALARALLAQYDTLFLDEPYKGLDGEAKSRAAALVEEAARGKRVILVTHDAEEASGYQQVRLGEKPA